MRKFIGRIFLLLPVLSFTGCFIREDPDLSKCPRDIRIELEWIDTAPISQQEEVAVKVYSREHQVLDTVSNIYGIDVSLVPGSYKVVGSEPSLNALIDGETLSLVTDNNNRSLPVSFFSAGIGNGDILPNLNDQVIYLPMRRQVRELVIMVEFAGNLAPVVTGIEGDLEGITLSRNLLDAFPPESGRQRPYALTRTDAIYDFGREVRNNGQIWFTGENNLIGIDGDSDQILNLSVTFNDGNNTLYPIDVTGMMTGFHTEDVAEPWYIILKLNISLDFLITIDDWYGGTDSYLVAE